MPKATFFAGIDVGTSFVKAVLIDGGSKLASSSVNRSGPDLQGSIAGAFEELLKGADATKDDIGHITATGYGRENVGIADSTRTEISCHARGAHHLFPGDITVVDIGGQDTKIIKVGPDGKTKGFRMNRKCAAGTGAFLEEIAMRLNTPLDEMNGLADRSTRDAPLNSYCTVFAKTEILTRIREGEAVEDMARSAYESVVNRVIEMDTLEGTIVMTGGVVAHNDVVRKILERHVGREVLTPERPQLTGALGAALFAAGV